MEQLLRNSFLFLSKNKIANKLAKNYGLRFGANKFVAGETIENAINSVKELNKKGIIATLDHLGEFVSSKEEALESTNHCIKTLEAIDKADVNSNLSLKLTQIGLDISEEFCLNNMRKILHKAKELDNFVRIDMEDYSRNEKTINIFKILKNEFGSHVGVVIQSYLYKSFDDIKALNKFNANLRICKGAYKESPDVAYPEKTDVDKNYSKLIKTHLLNKNYVGIATHDDKVIQELIRFIIDEKISDELFEFQMLHGIRTDLQEQLVNDGYKVRAYIPFGNDWYGYFMRRLAERPANVSFVLKSLFK